MRKKHGAERWRQWRKVHLGIATNTLEIRAIEVSYNSVGDSPMLPEWLGHIPLDETVASVSRDDNAAIAQRGAQAVIPPRKNARPQEGHAQGLAGTQRSAQGLSQAGAQHLEEVERLPPQESGGDQDAWLQAPGRAGDGAHV
jgi:hypothetical protein